MNTTQIPKYQQFYQNLYEKYGIKFRIIYHQLKTYISQLSKLEKIIFYFYHLIRTRSPPPPSLQLNNHYIHNHPHLLKLLINFEIRLLKTELSHNINKLQKLKHNIYKLKNIVIQSFLENETIDIFFQLNSYYLHLFKINYKNLNHKLKFNKFKNKNKNIPLNIPTIITIRKKMIYTKPNIKHNNLIPLNCTPANIIINNSLLINNDTTLPKNLTKTSNQTLLSPKPNITSPPKNLNHTLSHTNKITSPILKSISLPQPNPIENKLNSTTNKQEHFKTQPLIKSPQNIKIKSSYNLRTPQTHQPTSIPNKQINSLPINHATNQLPNPQNQSPVKKVINKHPINKNLLKRNIQIIEDNFHLPLIEFLQILNITTPKTLYTPPPKKTNSIINTNNTTLDPTQLYINLSNIQIPQNIHNLLNQGPNHTLNITNKDKLNIRSFSELDYLLRIIERSELKNNPSQILTPIQTNNLEAFSIKCKQKISNNQSKTNTPSQNDLELKELNNFLITNSLTISPADKSKTLIILTTKNYIDFMHSALETNSFSVSNINNTKSIELKLQNILREIHNNKQIDTQQYKLIYPSGSSPPTIFGKLKIHKNPPTMRPIVNGNNSYYIKIAQWLSNLFNKYIPSQFQIKNSIDLKHQLIKLKITPNTNIFSLDINNMYSFIDRPLVELFLLYQYKKDSTLTNKIPLYLLSELLQLCTSNITVQFNNQLYIQTSGLGMGNPLAALYAHIATYLIQIRLYYNSNLQLIYQASYADDLLFLSNSPTGPQDTLEYATEISTTFTYTLEIESNNKLNYLDITIYKYDSFLEFSVFRKPTSNIHKINFFSLYKYHIKFNTLLQETLRAFRICSTTSLLKNELETISNIYMHNNYPQSIINKAIAQANTITIQFKSLPPSLNTTAPQQFYTIKITNKNIITFINSQLQLLKNNQNWQNIKHIFLTEGAPQTLAKLTKHTGKPSIDQSQQKNIVYVSICKCQETYLGTSKRSYNTRLQQHLQTKSSPLYLHSLLGPQHAFNHNPESFKILFTETNTELRFLLESNAITILQPSLNLKQN